MRIVVMGGTGLIGAKVVQRLRSQGHNPVAASRATGADAFTGEGLAKVLRGASVVIDATRPPTLDDAAAMTFFRTASQNLLAAELKAGVRHHVAVSDVGTDRLQSSGYFRAKSAQEALVQFSGIAFTIVRATLCFEALGHLADACTINGEVRVPPAPMQPISAEEAATAIADYALRPPANGIVNIRGPETVSMDTALRRYLDARADGRTVVIDPTASYFGARLNDRSLICQGAARITPMRLADWLCTTAQFVA